MTVQKSEQQAREEILEKVKEYCSTYHNVKKPFEKGQRIPYASRVYDSAEMVNLVDSALEFWLTSGRYTDEFEKKMAEYLGLLLWRLRHLCLERGQSGVETRSSLWQQDFRQQLPQ